MDFQNICNEIGWPRFFLRHPVYNEASDDSSDAVKLNFDLLSLFHEPV